MSACLGLSKINPEIVVGLTEDYGYELAHNIYDKTDRLTMTLTDC